MISPAPSEAGDASKEEALYTVSVAAQLVGMHAQTLRQYDRLGLVSPRRTAGRGRRYTARDVQKLREVQRLSQEEGVNLAGVQLAMQLEQTIADLEEEVRDLQEALRATSAPARRIFSADSEGSVRLRAPRRRRAAAAKGQPKVAARSVEGMSASEALPAPSAGGALVGFDTYRGVAKSKSSTALIDRGTFSGWQRLAELSFGRKYQVRVSASALPHA